MFRFFLTFAVLAVAGLGAVFLYPDPPTEREKMETLITTCSITDGYAFIDSVGDCLRPGMPDFDAEAGLRMLTDECNAEAGQSCYLAGRVELSGWAGERDVPAGQELLLKACDLGIGDGCDLYSYFLSLGLAEPVRGVGEFEAAKRGCDLDAGMACTSAGVYILRRTSGPEAQDAIAFYERGCELDDLYSCASLSVIVSGGYYDTPVNIARGDALFRKACALGGADVPDYREFCADFR